MELIGGAFLIAISSVIIKLTYPKKWVSQASEKVSEEADEEFLTGANGYNPKKVGFWSAKNSDLMVPPLVQVNAKYYGWKLALYIAV